MCKYLFLVHTECIWVLEWYIWHQHLLVSAKISKPKYFESSKKSMWPNLTVSDSYILEQDFRRVWPVTCLVKFHNFLSPFLCPCKARWEDQKQKVLKINDPFTCRMFQVTKANLESPLTQFSPINMPSLPPSIRQSLQQSVIFLFHNLFSLCFSPNIKVIESLSDIGLDIIVFFV